MSGGKKVFVGNLDYGTSEEELKEFFEKAGKVVDSKIVRRGNRSKGFGFVEYETEEEAQKAVEMLDKENLNDRSINVQVSTSTGTKVGNSGNRDNNGPPRRYNNGPPRRYNNNYGNNNYRRPQYNNNNNSGGRRFYYLKNERNYDYDYDYDDVPRRRGPPRRNNNNSNNKPKGPRRESQNNQKDDTEKVESKTTIFVANLPFSIDDEELIELFGKCGAIKTAHVVKNRGRSKGYGFVEFVDNEGQLKALKDMDNFPMEYKNGEERSLSVKVAMSSGDVEITEKQEDTEQ